MAKNKHTIAITFFAFIQFFILPGCKNKEPSHATPADRLKQEGFMKEIAKNMRFVVSLNTEPGNAFPGVTAFIAKYGEGNYVISARHGYRGSSIEGKESEIVFVDQTRKRVHYVGEIQTLDIVVFAIDGPVFFPTATFAKLSETFERGESYSSGYHNERIVVMRCLNDTEFIKYRHNDPTSYNREKVFSLDRILLAEIIKWSDKEQTDKWYTIRLDQKQQRIEGCSGAPIINLRGEVIGMIQSAFGNAVYGLDANGVRGSFNAIVEEYLNGTQGGQ